MRFASVHIGDEFGFGDIGLVNQMNRLIIFKWPGLIFYYVDRSFLIGLIRGHGVEHCVIRLESGVQKGRETGI